MKAPENWIEVYQGKRYSVEHSTLIASDAWWDGHNFERNGRNHFLYRTKNGSFFLVTLTMWQGEQNRLVPISQEEAISLYEDELTEHYEVHADAFPDVKIVEA